MTLLPAPGAAHPMQALWVRPALESAQPVTGSAWVPSSLSLKELPALVALSCVSYELNCKFCISQSTLAKYCDT